MERNAQGWLIVDPEYEAIMQFNEGLGPQPLLKYHQPPVFVPKFKPFTFELLGSDIVDIRSLVGKAYKSSLRIATQILEKMTGRRKIKHTRVF